MKKQNTFAAVLAGILAGTVLGASTFAVAEVVSYRYDKHTVVRLKTNLHRYDTFQDAEHAAAPQAPDATEKCKKYSGTRLSRCMNQNGHYFDSQY